MKEEFAVVIRPYKMFGYIALPVLIEQNSTVKYHMVVEQVDSRRVNKSRSDFTENQINIVDISEEYNNSGLLKQFASKKGSFMEFCNSLDADFIKKHIRPYIEERIIQVIEILKKTDIKAFLQDDIRSSLGRENVIHTHKQSVETIFHFVREEEQIKHYLSHTINGKNISFQNTKAIVFNNFPCYVILENSLYFLEGIEGKKLVPFFTRPSISIPESSEKFWFKSFATNAVSKFSIHVEGFDISEQNSSKSATIALKLDDLQVPVLELHFLYDGVKFNSSRLNEPYVTFYTEKDGSFKFIRISRDIEWEQRLIEKLKDSDLVQHGSDFRFSIASDISQDEKISLFTNLMKDRKGLFTKAGFTILPSSIPQKKEVAQDSPLDDFLEIELSE